MPVEGSGQMTQEMRSSEWTTGIGLGRGSEGTDDGGVVSNGWFDCSYDLKGI